MRAYACVRMRAYAYARERSTAACDTQTSHSVDTIIKVPPSRASHKSIPPSSTCVPKTNVLPGRRFVMLYKEHISQVRLKTKSREA